MKLAKSTIRRIINRLGYTITRTPPPAAALPPEYGVVRPWANYSPWQTDAAFRETFAAIERHTLVDRYRCFELWQLVAQSAKLPAGGIIEIGVWRGGTGALIARQAQRCGIADRVLLCDTFTGVVKAGANDSLYLGGEHADTSRQTAEDLLFTQMCLDNVEILEGIFPDATGHRAADMAFRFCHIDVDVYQSARDVVEWIWDRMVPGGIIVYDDYGFLGCDGITRYVNEQMPLNDRLVVHNLNGHAIVVKQ